MSSGGVRTPPNSCSWAFRLGDNPEKPLAGPPDRALPLACSPGETVEYDSFALPRPLAEFVDDLGVVSVEWFE